MNYLPLSDRGVLVMDIVHCSTDIARIMEHYAGFRMPFKAGDTFVRQDFWSKQAAVLHSVYATQLRPVGAKQTNGHWGERFFDGKTFHVFRVVRVTAASIFTVFEKTVHVYGKDIRRGYAARFPFDPTDVAGIHEMIAPAPQMIRRFRTRRTDGTDLVLYNQINMNMNNVVRLPVQTRAIVQYDCDTKVLEITAAVNRLRL